MSDSPKQKDLNKRTESIDSNEISMEIEDNTNKQGNFLMGIDNKPLVGSTLLSPYFFL